MVAGGGTLGRTGILIMDLLDGFIKFSSMDLSSANESVDAGIKEAGFLVSVTS
jgi:hypothetical protein